MLPLWLGAGLGLGLGLRWSLCLGMGYCTGFDPGFGFALRFGAALNCVLGLYFGFGSRLAPRSFALGSLSCKLKTIEPMEQIHNNSFNVWQGATLPRLLPHYCPLARFFCKHVLFSKRIMIAICADTIALQLSG